MAFDLHKNLAISAVAVTPSPAASGTSLSVAAGEGARFPDAPFNATVSPANAMPTPANAEIVRVTAKTGDEFTVVRAQEGTTARAIVVGDMIAATITAKVIEDIESGLNFPQIITPGNVKAANLKWQQGHTWALAGDVTPLSWLPGMYVPLIGTQVVRVVGLWSRIQTGTSVTLTPYFANVAQPDIVVTTTLTLTPFNYTVPAGTEFYLRLTAPVGAPTNFTATMILEHSL